MVSLGFWGKFWGLFAFGFFLSLVLFFRWRSRQTLLCRAALCLKGKVRHRTHVFSIPNILRSKAVCKENDGYCYPPECQCNLQSEQPHCTQPHWVPAWLLMLSLAWDSDGDSQVLGCLGSLFWWERHELPS